MSVVRGPVDRARAQDTEIPRARSALPLSEQLTAKGRIMPSGSVSWFWSNDSPSGYGSYATWTFRAEPSATYFVRDRLGVTVGIQASVAAGDVYPAGRYKDRALGTFIGLRWAIPASDRWTVLLSPSVGYVYQWADARLFATGGIPALVDFQGEEHFIRFALCTPFLYAFNPHVALGLGPDFSFDHSLGLDRHTRIEGGESVGVNVFYGSGDRMQLGASVGVYGSF